MSKSQSLSGMRYKKENFRALKDDMMNIEKNFGGGSGPSVVMNENCEFVCRIQNRNSKISNPTPEQKYLLNEILKYYELNSNQIVQGFNSQYFSDLTELMSKRNMKTSEYTKKRIELFNSRVNNNHKSYINYLKKEGKDTKMKSSMNKTINPMNVTYNLKLNDNNNPFNSTMKKANKSNSSFFIDFKKLYLNRYAKNFFYRNDKNDTTSSDKNFSSNRNNKYKENKTLFKSASYINKYKTKNDDLKLAHNLSLVNYKIKEEINKNDEEMEIMEKKSKDEYFYTRNKKKYMNFLKSKYHFVEGKNPEKKEPKLSIKDIKIKNMFKIKPKDIFLKKQSEVEDKKLFFKKLEKDIKKQNDSESEFKKIRLRTNKKQLSNSFYKHNIIYNSVIQHYNKFFENQLK